MVGDVEVTIFGVESFEEFRSDPENTTRQNIVNAIIVACVAVQSCFHIEIDHMHVLKDIRKRCDIKGHQRPSLKKLYLSMTDVLHVYRVASIIPLDLISANLLQ